MRILCLPVDFVKISIKSKRFPLLVIAVVSVTAILLAVSVFIAKRSSAHGVNPAKKTASAVKISQGPGPLIFRRMIGTYYNTNGSWKSTLVLNNKGPNTIAVTPILYSLDGRRFEAPVVAVDSRRPLELDLNALAQTAGPEFRSGSFEFTYTGHWMEVGGGLRVVDEAKSLIFEEQMREPGMKFPNPQLESVFSIPFKSSDVNLILTNTTDKALTVSGQAIFAGSTVNTPISFDLASRQSVVFKLPPHLIRHSKAGAISLTHNGETGALLAMVHVEEEARGFSLAVNLSTGQGITNQIHGAG